MKSGYESICRYFANKDKLYRRSPMKLVIREVPGNQERLQQNGTHQPLAYTDCMDLPAENLNVVRSNTETPLVAC